MHGWGVPTATDIAFALGIMALLGNRVPNGVRVFLSTLAVADDIIAIIVIAVFYGNAPSFAWLGAAAVVLIVLVAMNRLHVYSIAPYLLAGVVLWVCVFMSGVHSTIAGVLLAFTIPTGSRIDLAGFADWSGKKVRQAREAFRPDEPVMGQDDYIHHVHGLSKVARQVVPPAKGLEHALNPWVNFIILPLFALTNADVALSGGSGNLLGRPGLRLSACWPASLWASYRSSFITVKRRSRVCRRRTDAYARCWYPSGVASPRLTFAANLASEDSGHDGKGRHPVRLSALAGVLGFLVCGAGEQGQKARGRIHHDKQ